MTGTDRSVAYLQLLPRSIEAQAKSSLYPLTGADSFAIGRDFRCQIVLDPTVYRSVSRRHAEVSLIAGFEASDGRRFWQVCDLNSSNGTFVNGTRLQGCQILQNGDRITLGQNGPEFVFECQATVEPQPEASFQPEAIALDELYPTAPPPAKASSASASSKSAARFSGSRSPDSVSMTQLFPILSTGRELAQKAYLLPAGITILFVVLLFLAIGNPFVFNVLLASYLAGAAYYFVYQLCGKFKPWWMIVSMAVCTALLLVSPLLDLFIFVFHRLLPGDLVNTTSQTNFLVLLVKMFFGAGLMEELLKAVPVIVATWIGTRLKPTLRQKVGVWEPLDGILLGAACAVGFSLMETLGVYVPATYKSALALAGQDAAQLASLQLLIPRVLGLVAGHMAYSGYLGYFIGLSSLRRRQRKLILGVGLLTSSVLHTLWNAAGMVNPVFLALIGSISYAFLGAAILKARALSPTRSQNFATRFYQ
ncbi:MAG: PrsW family intramembrane metalloprotease [Oscillatoriales cyanobacterium C42_A2020_001]|nr:PrsW family intramembrane metalloprotease [Leptolyngbyaceae cyanobacterium C42_A2020_001]